MKIFIFEQVEQLTSSYHGGGGLVIIAESEEHAKELIMADKYINLSDEEWLRYYNIVVVCIIYDFSDVVF